MIKKNKNSGFTLLEIIITIAILAIAAAFMATSYTNVMEDQRKDSDMSKLNEVDVAFKEILLYEDAFEEIQDFVFDDRYLTIRLNVTNDSNSGDSFIEMEDVTINGTSNLLKNKCEKTYDYLVAVIGNKIELDANTHKQGYYEIYLEFNGTQVSEVRDFVITNDGIMTTNSGDEFLKEHN